MCFMLFIVLPQNFYDALKDVPKIVGCGKEKNGCGANLYSGEMLFDEARHYIRRFGWFVFICTIIKSEKNTHAGMLLLVKLQA